MYDVITQDSDSKDGATLQWYCKPSCNKVAAKFSSVLKNSQDQMNMMKEELTATKQTLEKIEDGKFSEKMETEIRRIAKEEAEGIQAPQIEETVRQIVQNENEGSPNHSGEKGDAKEQLAEIEDRLRRKTNLVIFKLPEAEKQDEQTTKCNSKATEILELLKMDPRPKDIRRLGKPST